MQLSAVLGQWSLLLPLPSRTSLARYVYVTYTPLHILIMSLGDIDVKHMASTIRPARKRGRPRNAARALINDDPIDVEALKPGDWKNAYVRHPQYLNGMCVD